MSFRGLLVLVIILAALLYYFGKPQEWWGDMTRAARRVNSVPAADTMP
ncbi:MAG TPA: hypothetical protein VFK09_04485 [Gemmatimonadales bacterium]|nr:hypothetical protein [Gemmatimonadales bacterium]